MTYKYKCGNEIIREDENGKFFTWNRNKIYLNDWIKISMKELKEKIENGEWITSDDLCQAIMTDGIENVRFMVPLNTTCGLFFLNGNEFKDTLCKVEERWNREIKQNYKIVLIPEEPDDSVTSSRDYYTTDFVSLIKEGHIKIVA